ncbi:MAG TPA: bifunctional anthranilate synthase component II/anthranilate phosphoribosyltransferase [Candidatus Limnocylindria bacterium]|nr:bifunctional anthranilate synthase component II/anthranilate phosphoribosyltransferase [Candidatus Limnocylindria bacterium]
MIAVIDNYDSFTYNLVQYLCELGAEVRVYRNDAVSVEELVGLSPDGLVISPGPGGPESAGISLGAVRALSDRIPILGVCLGHQCIGKAFGGKVVHAATLMHGKTSQILHNGKGIFSMIENPMTATRYHSLAIERESLPSVLEVCAEAEDGEVMGIRHVSRPVYGVQFHPESILTRYGMRILENFLSLIDPRQPVRLCFGNMREAISQVASGKNLTPDEMRDAMNMIMGGEATPAQISSFLSCLAMKGETTEEITAAALVMRQKAARISAPANEPLLDTCGTGGDRSGTFNISTTVAFVAAGAGIRVAKHGNRSVTSRSGSADVLESLGMNLQASFADVQRALDEAGVTFMFAPKFHAAMKYAIGPRREIGIRTIFNILGPLSNPAGANRQIVGVYSEDLGEPYARVLAELGQRRSFVVHGTDGMDEVTLSAPTIVWDVREGEMRRYLFDPRSVGFECASSQEIKGGDAATNARILKEVLSGKHGFTRDAVLLNAGFAIVAGGKAEDVREGIALAKRSIDSGAAMDRLRKFLNILGTGEAV